MISQPVVSFLWAVSSTCGFVAASFFVSFWRETKDILFLLFALAFVLLGAQWALLSLRSFSEHAHLTYMLRLVASLTIIAAIIQKNRK